MRGHLDAEAVHLRILDFGCGSGRVLRHLVGDPRLELFGAEVNSSAAKWCQHHLPGTTVVACRPLPPLPFENGSIDLAYAFSVLTHMGEDAQRSWIRELHRLLRPGGTLLLSLHGEHCIGRLAADRKTAFAGGSTVVLLDREEFSNWCLAYHPPIAVSDLIAECFSVEEHQPAGALGNPPQDLWVLRRE